MTVGQVRRHVGVALMLLLGAVSATAQTPTPKSAAEFYMQYRKVFDSATKIDQLLPYMAADTRKEIESTPPTERAEMFELVKMMGAVKNVKVVNEARKGETVVLTVEAVDPDQEPTTGTITVVTESGAFKLSRESWSSK